MWKIVETEGASPPSEAGFRRPDILDGRFVRLADGRGWAFPGPSEIAAAGQAVGAEVRALLVGVAEAEDEADRLRGELALAIRLLATNDDLSPAGHSRLLSSTPDRPGIAEMQMSFRDLARRHAQALKPREALAVSRGRRFHWPPSGDIALPQGAPAEARGPGEISTRRENLFHKPGFQPKNPFLRAIRAYETDSECGSAAHLRPGGLNN